MLFSLNGLLEVEKERVERELREHRLAGEAALARIEAKKRAEREAELERQRLASEEAQRRKEQEIRLAAVAQATLETARAEAAARARIELLEKQQEHERRMAALRGQGQRGSQVAAAGLGVAVLCLAGSLGVYFGKLRPDTQRVQAAYDGLVAVERARADETKRQLERSEKRRTELGAELETARQRLADLESKEPVPSAGPTPARPTAAPPAAPSKPRRPCTDDGDPMNDCLK